MPAKLHMTVPSNFRRSAKVPRVLVLHKADMSAADIEERDGYRVVKLLRAIKDLLAEGSEDRRHLRQALQEALSRGLITHRQIGQTPLASILRVQDKQGI